MLMPGDHSESPMLNGPCSGPKSVEPIDRKNRYLVSKNGMPIGCPPDLANEVDEISIRRTATCRKDKPGKSGAKRVAADH